MENWLDWKYDLIGNWIFNWENNDKQVWRSSQIRVLDLGLRDNWYYLKNLGLSKIESLIWIIHI